MRRVVVTGLGMVSPLGCGVETSWKRILNSESGAKKIETFDVSDLTSRIACLIPRGDGSNGTFNPDQWMEPKDQRKVDDFIIFAMCAARQALEDADVMVAGGTESPICRLSMAGFCASRALSTGFNETPERASRPYDRDRDGFVMGEGAGIAVLEEYEHAKSRGARIYAEVIGYGLSGDAYHITAP